MAFTIKVAKLRKRGKASKTAPLQLCPEHHCISIPGHCSKLVCTQRLSQDLRQLQNDNLSLSLALGSRYAAVKALQDDIFGLISPQTAGVTAQEPDVTSNCQCATCQIATEKTTTQVLGEKLAAAENQLADLREYQASHDVGAVQETPNNFGQGKYFTRSGTYRGHGATALKPKLQMQNSYDVDALTTNIMATRPIKTAVDRKNAGC